jgi:hypothetical protein
VRRTPWQSWWQSKPEPLCTVGTHQLMAAGPLLSRLAPWRPSGVAMLASPARSLDVACGCVGDCPVMAMTRCTTNVLCACCLQAGSGGVGPTIMETSLLLAGEEATAYVNNKKARAARGLTRHMLGVAASARERASAQPCKLDKAHNNGHGGCRHFREFLLPFRAGLCPCVMAGGTFMQCLFFYAKVKECASMLASTTLVPNLHPYLTGGRCWRRPSAARG